MPITVPLSFISARQNEIRGHCTASSLFHSIGPPVTCTSLPHPSSPPRLYCGTLVFLQNGMPHTESGWSFPSGIRRFLTERDLLHTATTARFVCKVKKKRSIEKGNATYQPLVRNMQAVGLFLYLYFYFSFSIFTMSFGDGCFLEVRLQRGAAFLRYVPFHLSQCPITPGVAGAKVSS